MTDAGGFRGTRSLGMGKFVPTCPARFYKEFETYGYSPPTVLLLAHDVVADPLYEEIFRRDWFDQTTIIMDNSLVELGHAADIDMVEKAAKMVGANIVVPPDVMGDGIASTRVTMEAWPTWQKRFKGAALMPLIHGFTFKEWVRSAEMLATLEPEWVGIPRITEDVLGPKENVHRGTLVGMVRALMPKAKIHLFGFSNYIHWDLMSAAHPEVKGIDSAVPFRLKTKNILSEDAGPRGHWWKYGKFDPQCIETCKLIDEHIERFPW